MMRKSSNRKSYPQQNRPSERNSAIRESWAQLRLIGDGDLQEVWKIDTYPNVKIGIWSLPTTKKNVAIKNLKEVKITKELNDLLQEICKLDDHDHVNALYGICLTETVIKLVTEYARFGSLVDVMTDSELKHFFCQHIRLKNFAIQICSGMTYIAERGLVHGNLTPRNVLVADADLVRVADVGLARTLNRGWPFTADKAGFAVEWCAPEVLRNEGCTDKSDIYSYGVLLRQMMTFGEEPWKHISKDKIVEYRIAHPYERPGKPNRCCHSKIIDLMDACWTEKPADRPNFKDIARLLGEITYSVGSTTVKRTDFSRDCFSFGFNSRMTLLERLDDTQWLAQNEEAIVGIIRKDMVNLKTAPQERHLPTKISRPLNPIKETSFSSVVERKVDADTLEEGTELMSNLIDLPCVTPGLNNAQGYKENKRTEIEHKGITEEGCQPPPVPPRSNLNVLGPQADGALLRGFSADTVVVPFSACEIFNKTGSPPVGKDLVRCSKKENDEPDNEGGLLIDLFTTIPSVIPSPARSVSNHNDQGDKDQEQKECFPLVDLSENGKQLSETRTVSKETNEQQNNERDGQGSNRQFHERPLRVNTASHDRTTFDERVQTPSISSDGTSAYHHGPDIQGAIYQVPFHIPIPDSVPYVDPERLRQPPPAKQKDISYGGETDSLIVRLQREFPNMTRDECYVRLLSYNHDIEMIIKILKVNFLTGFDEESARYHLKHCNWDVERAVDYILSKSE